MSLATRCPACGTVFRVVEDQLKVSEGWVRCGRCAEVFNAGEAMVDLAAASAAGTSAAAPAEVPPAATAGGAPAGAAAWDDTPVPGLPEAAAGAGQAPAATAAGAAQPLADDWLRRPARDDGRVEPTFGAPTPAEASSGAAGAGGPAAGGLFTRAAPYATPATPPGAAPSAPGPLPAAPAGDEAARGDTSGPTSLPGPTPGFVRRAERAEAWRRPGVRAVLALVALALGLLLAAQATLVWRDEGVARHPALRPWAEAVCAAAGCRVEPPRRPDSLLVQTSALTQLEGTGLYRLSLVLRNRGATAVMTPALDVALTDTQGQVLARRVYTAVELGHAPAALEPGAEVALSGVVGPPGLAVAGYTIELFYP